MEKSLNKKSAENKSVAKKDTTKARRTGSEKYDTDVMLVQKGCK